MTELSDEVFEELQAKHGPLETLTAGGFEITYRKPTAAEWQMIMEKAANRDVRVPEILLRLLIIPKELALEIIDEIKASKPMLIGLFSNAILEELGSELVVQKKERSTSGASRTATKN